MAIDAIRLRYPEAETFRFGDSEGLSAALLALVRSGSKTATCGALRDSAEDGEAFPVVGRRDIALEWDGHPALVIETVEVTIRRFCDVDAINVAAIETVWHGLITPPKGETVTSKNYSGKEIKLEKGEEMGRFNMGSTVILLFSDDAPDLAKDLKVDRGLKLGEGLSSQ